jgi:hypothetical protein
METMDHARRGQGLCECTFDRRWHYIAWNHIQAPWAIRKYASAMIDAITVVVFLLILRIDLSGAIALTVQFSRNAHFADTLTLHINSRNSFGIVCRVDRQVLLECFASCNLCLYYAKVAISLFSPEDIAAVAGRSAVWSRQRKMISELMQLC